MANVLLLGSGTQALAILKSLHMAGHRILMLLGEKGNYADASRYVYKNIYTDADDTSLNYYELVKRIIKDEGVDVILPMGDTSAEFLSRNKDVLQKDIKITIPSYYNFLKGYDKNKLMSLCSEKGYPHPLTIDLSSIGENGKKELLTFPYPGLLKPNCTTGGRGMVLINNYDELQNIYPDIHATYGDCHLQRFIRAGGRQVKIQLYVNEDGNLLHQSVLHKVRWYPVKGGASCCAVSIRDDKMVSICYQILRDINWVGFADFDTIEDPDTGELLIMEINPRLPACIGASVYAGIDWGEVLVQGALRGEQKCYKYKEGVTLRHLGFDVLWFIRSPRRLSTKPSWFRFVGKEVHYQDFHFWDQKPFWVGTYHNLKKLFDPNFKKAKSGTSRV